jgi:sulfur carrier protein
MGFFIFTGGGMNIILNGNPMEIQGGLTVEALVLSRGLDPSRVVVERNGDISDSVNWPQTMLKENDKIELISFVGGG